MELAVNLDKLMSAFEAYNHAIWPVQVLAYLLGLIALYSASKTTRVSNNVTSGILSFFWLWTGIAFCIIYWGPIYPAAYIFGVLFIAQGMLFFAGAFRPKLSFHTGSNLHSIIGLLFIAYAMIGYPVMGHFLGHTYPRSLPFGLVPCPTAVLTFGLFMLTDKKVPKHILVIPAFWALCAFVPVFSGILEDAGLVIAGLVCTPMILLRDRRSQGERTNTASAP